LGTEVLDSSAEKDLCQLVGTFSTPTRQRIVRLLASGKPYTFTEILNHLRTFDETVRSNNLSYHLKELGDLIAQNERAEYTITPKGQYLKEILDDLEATEAMTQEGVPSQEGKGAGIRIEKVVIGGMLIKVSPKTFVELIQETGGKAIHSKIGTFRPKELYLSCIDGVNYYCKSKKPLDELQKVSEALRVEIPKNMIVDI